MPNYKGGVFMNVTVLTGRLTADPNLKFTSTGRAVTKFTLAVNRPFASQKGERKTDFIPVTIWGNSAELAAKTLHKGQRVNISGTIYTDEYEKDGKKIRTFYVNADRFEYVEKKQDTEQEESVEAEPSHAE